MTTYNVQESERNYLKIQRPIKNLFVDIFYRGKTNGKKEEILEKRASEFCMDIEGQIAGI